MAIVLTVAAATKAIQNGTLRISQTANGRGTASFQLTSLDATYRPALDAEVIITEGGTRIFGGLLDRPREKGIVDGSSVGITNTMDAVDFNAYTERVHVNETIPAGTLEDALVVVTTYLATYGVTLHASQVTGPNLPELIYDLRRVDAVLNELATLTADAGEPYVWRIDHFKVLRMYQPSTTAAPFDLVGEAIPEVVGDVEVESTRGSAYANKVYVRTPSRQEMNRVETFTGDGTTDDFILQYTPFSFRGYVLHDGVVESFGDDVQFPILPGTQWTFDRTTNTLTAATAPGNGDVIQIYFDGTYSGVGIASDSGEITTNKLWERVFTVENIPSDTTAQALADSYLARAIPVIKTIRYRTFELGLEVGQTQTVTITRRALSATAVITDIGIRDIVKDGTNVLVRDVTAVIDAAQTNLGRGFRDVYKQWFGDKTGSALAASTTTVGTGGATPGASITTDNYVIKSADQSVNNSTTLVNCTDLVFPVVANALYELEVVIFHAGTSTGSDLKHGWTVPSGTSMYWGAVGEGSGMWQAGTVFASATSLNGAATLDGAGSFDSTGVNPGGRFIRGIVWTAGTAGNVQFQFAQNAATVGDNTVKQYSYIRYRRLGAA